VWRMESLLRISEVAKLLGISRRQIERFMASGVLPRPIKQGRGSFLAVSEVEAYIERCKETRGR